jgi:hypothetical protein
MTALDLSADVGLLTVFLATANICLGLLIAVRYSPSRRWPHRRANIFAVHWSSAAGVDLPRSEPEAELLLLKQSNWKRIKLLGHSLQRCDSESWPVIVG